jgi:hypothetical protein
VLCDPLGQAEREIGLGEEKERPGFDDLQPVGIPVTVTVAAEIGELIPGDAQLDSSPVG